jgi:hypothetical protein
LEALAWAYPHLAADLQSEVKAFLAREWAAHAPVSRSAWYSLKEGERRERFWTPDEVQTRLGQDKPPHPFGNTHSAWFYAERCGEWERLLAAWPQIKAAFDDFVKTGWRLDAAKGDLHANRYFASLLAFNRVAERAKDAAAATAARAMAAETSDALAAWWKRAAAGGTLTHFQGSSELDPFIGKGDAISFRIAPHRHEVALFRDLTPEVARILQTRGPEAIGAVWSVFEALYATWPFVGEKRQVHFGENFVDPPDLAMGAFKALAWLRNAPPDSLARRIDLPFCRADLYHLEKLALTLEAGRQ